MTLPKVRAFFHEPTFTVSYLVWDAETKNGAIIDSVLDFDQSSGRTGTHSAEAILAAAKAEGVTINWLLETHAHADHISGAPFLKKATAAPIAIGERIKAVQQVFKDVFNLAYVTADGRPFDKLVADGEVLKLGALEIKVIHTPGHTPACVSYLIGDALFVGDTMFMPDFGTARADFPGGDARTLYRSIQKLLALPPETRIFLCHDYKAPGRDVFAWESTVGEERAKNIHLANVSEDEFVAIREARDKTLSMPALILPSIQVNIQAGELPPPEPNGVRYLKLPINAL
ncbi:MBL fold metallo-hydrolase [Candidatus Viadribacter manganicus]|uniref:MBL fold metallo-hydrolase n=1 Tax=Candidatus Viadribacter manganicus TaxID=1759059 RepID=A0A1B1AIN2_9PROT|nr:MBL fold metallo-hydrolase [Candidatus Viadribacter manganicus]ANP46424.1 MBL fold metallo-hydrolase [Candidatus Viadribacter manganicus]